MYLVKRKHTDRVIDVLHIHGYDAVLHLARCLYGFDIYITEIEEI